jgi:hypothetical protein
MVADHQGGGNQRGVTHLPNEVGGFRPSPSLWASLSPHTRRRASGAKVLHQGVDPAVCQVLCDRSSCLQGTAGLGNCGGTGLRTGARAGRMGRSKFLSRTFRRSSAFAAGQIKFHTTPDGT